MSVYLVDSGTTKDGLRVVKVGYTSNLSSRLCSIKNTWPDAVVVRVWEGDYDVERGVQGRLRNRFASSREVFYVPTIAEALDCIGDPSDPSIRVVRKSSRKKRQRPEPIVWVDSYEGEIEGRTEIVCFRPQADKKPVVFIGEFVGRRYLMTIALWNEDGETNGAETYTPSGKQWF